MAGPLRLKLYWDGGGGAKLFKVTGVQGSRVYTEIPIPVGLTITKRRPCFAEAVDGYVIITNFWETPVVVYDDGAGNIGAWQAGLASPAVTLVVAPESGGHLTANVTEAYISYVHETPSGRPLAQSGLSNNGLSVNIAVTNSKLAYSGLPTVSPDGRSNRIYGWLAVEGGIIRQVFNVPFSSETEIVDTTVAYLVEQVAWPNDGLEIRTQMRARPPKCRYCFLYHHQMFYAMEEPDNGFRMYYSEIDEMESVDPSNYFDTLGKETITGIGEQADLLVVFCRRCKYGLQGWTSGNTGNPADMGLRKVDPAIGTVCHHSVVNINGKLFYWALDGLRIWDGTSHWIGDKSDAVDAFRANPHAFYNGIAINDVTEHVYIFQPYFPPSPTQPAGGGYAYVYDYSPADPTLGGGGAELPWSRDKRARVDTMRAAWLEDDGTVNQVTGSIDGFSRLENQYQNVDDDEDAYLKRMVLAGRHHYFDVPEGGLLFEGKSYDRLWCYLECPQGTLDVQVYAGDQGAYSRALGPSATFSLTDPQTPQWRGPTLYTPIPRAVWEVKPQVSGRGLTVEFSISTPPQGTMWYGYTVWWRPGSSAAIAQAKQSY